MRISEHWKDYELIDCSYGERLERWGDVILIRPDPQVIWKTEKENPLWETAHAKYIRPLSGTGSWKYYKNIPELWEIGYRDMVFKVRPTGFKHTGLFPEQAANWDLISEIIKESGKPVKVLNLFAYTGASTVSALHSGASVVHVDASKGMVNWAKENAALSKVDDKNVRWIVDDCKKFVTREIRRNNKYDIVIMDPPSYGHGPSGEVFKIENEIFDLAKLCSNVLTDKPLAFMVNSYTAGLSPCTMGYILNFVLSKKYKGSVNTSEIGLKVTSSSLALSCGSTAVWRNSK